MGDAAQRGPPADAEALRAALGAELRASLGDELRGLELTFRSRAAGVADGTTVFLLGAEGAAARGVLLCSAPAAPDLVRRSAERAAAAAQALGPELGAHVLLPFAEGRLQGLSWTLSRFCDPLSDGRLAWALQRALLRDAVLDWLWGVTVRTAAAVAPHQVEPAFARPLRQLAALEAVAAPIRAAAEGALARLERGAWVPRHVLMHGDLWKGNVLVRRRADAPGVRRWTDRFAVIDWAGSAVRGYGLFDLVRLAYSFPLRRPRLAVEVRRHCEALGCGVEDASAHLLAALGHVALDLEQLPLARFVRMADDCWALLGAATGAAQGAARGAPATP